MKKRFTLFLLLCIAVTTTLAESINERQARDIATQFMLTHAMPSFNLKMAHKAPLGGATTQNADAAFYVFNGASGGYVIVAGDNRAPAVLGYSDKGTFDWEEIPEAMQELLEGYAAQMKVLAASDVKMAAHLTSRAPIAPLVSALFSQNAPFYVQLPFISGKHPPVGCVATALAQVLYYWKYPATTTREIPEYTTKDLGIFMPALPVTTFNWSAMQDTYLYSDSLSAAGQAVAQLSLYCAQSVKMNFKKNSSAANTRDITTAIVNYFGYKSSVRYLQRKYYPTQEWENMIYNELAARRPVIYRGNKEEGGHAFVCDGYDGQGMFHINWGWNGSSNGYFLLSILNPDSQGTGGADGTYGYIQDQAMVYGIEPGTIAPSSDPEVTVRQIEVQSYSNTRSSSDQNFSASVLTHYLNNTNYTISFDYGWALYQGSRMVKLINDGYYYNDLSSGYYTYPTRTIYFGNGLSNGTYRLVAMYSKRNSNNWKQCVGSDVNYAQVIINGNNCSITNYGLSSTPSYQVNDVSITGHMHPNRPVYIDMNLTNTGNTRNDIIYMFVNGKIVGEGFIDVDKGSSAVVNFEYLTETAGYVSLSFSLNDDGSNPIANRTISIEPMPKANLSGTANALNVTDTQNRIITSDKYSVVLTITNNNSTTYNEDITIRLYKNIYGNYGTTVQTLSKPLVLGPHQRTTIQFDLDNVADGWKYFTKSYYYSEGEMISLASTSFYTIVIPQTEPFINGDVNKDGEVNISDINALTGYILTGNGQGLNLEAADCNKDGEINISDINALINIILN